MKIECTENTGIDLPIQLFSHHGWNTEMEFKDITIGRDYIVYAIIHVKDVPFYLICGDTYDGDYVTYPSLLPEGLFRIVDDSYSKYWIRKKDSKDIGFKEIINMKYFYGHLVEGYENEVCIFLKRKAEIDKEYC